jgi:uncharacterized protein YecT (DUF1311 family)
MLRIFFSTLCLCLWLISGASEAQTRKTWVNSCQAKDSELSGSYGYRICTSQFLNVLEKQQAVLLKKLAIRFIDSVDENTNPKAASKHLAESQKVWLRYANEHCEIAQSMFGTGNASGDVMPSCMIGEYEARNKQLSLMLNGTYER